MPVQRVSARGFSVRSDRGSRGDLFAASRERFCGLGGGDPFDDILKNNTTA